MQVSSQLNTRVLLYEMQTHTVLARLSLALYSHPYRDKGLLEGTRTQLLDRIKAWELEDSKALLWLSDAPGTGKSTIAVHCAERWKAGGVLVASLYFRRDNPARQNEIWISVAASISQAYPLARRYIVAAILESPYLLTDTPSVQLQKLVVNPLYLAHEHIPRTHPLFIVLDALDECPTEQRRDVLEGLMELKHIPMIKIFTTSRRDHTFPKTSDISTQMPSDVERDEFDPEADIVDVERYILDRLQGVTLRSREAAVAGRIRRLLNRAGHHHFLWAQLLCDILETDPSPDERLAIFGSECRTFKTAHEVYRCYLSLKWERSDFKPLDPTRPVSTDGTSANKFWS